MGMIVSFGLMMLSMLGYWLWGSRRFGVRLMFMPAVFCAGVVNLMFVAGILNLLQPMEFAIYLAGFALLALSVKRGLRLTRTELAFLAFFMAVAAGYALLFRGRLLTAYDDFSHWGTAAKEMMREDRLPRQGSLVIFQSYPMASTLFIYYIGNIVGSTDGVKLWSQFLFEFSLIVSLFGLVRRKNAAGAAAVALFGVCALVMCTYITSLNVDTLLALAPVAGYAVMLAHRDRPERAMLFAGLFAALTVNVKNSGLFFAGALALSCAWCVRASLPGLGRRFALSCALPPVAAAILWNRHVELVFPAGLSSKHAMSLSRFGDVAAQKSAQEIRAIADGMVSGLLSGGSVVVRMLALCLVALLALSLLRPAKGRARAFALASGALIATALLYELGIFGMYVFSMPAQEAARLAGLDRYERTCALFMLGATLAFALARLKEAETTGWRRAAVLAALALAVCVPLRERWQGVYTLYTAPNQTRTERYRLLQAHEALGLEDGKSYLFYRSEPDDGLLTYLSRYELWSSQTWTTADVDEALRDAPNYDYLVLWDAQDGETTPFLELGERVGEIDGMIVLKTK